MAGLAKLRLCFPARDKIPDTALVLAPVDTVTVDAGALRDETELFGPLVCCGIVHGVLYVQLILMAEATEIRNGGSEQSWASGLGVDVVTGCAEYCPVIAQPQAIRQILDVFGESLAHVRRFHAFSRSTRSVAVLADVCRSVPVCKVGPDAVLLVLTVDRVTVDT